LVLRVLGNACRHLGALAQRLYDLPLFVPLWIEAQKTAAAAQGAWNAHVSREAKTLQEAQS
jgi:hypothetical protein